MVAAAASTVGVRGRLCGGSAGFMVSVATGRVFNLRLYVLKNQLKRCRGVHLLI